MNTITPSPIAAFKGQVGARTWNLLLRHGLNDLTTLRQALADGLKPGDCKGLGQVALLEIRLALDNTPEPAEAPPAAVTDLSPLAEGASALSGRELTLLLALAEAGMDHLDPRVSVNEALATLGHLRQLAGEDEVGDLYPAPPGLITVNGEPAQLPLTADVEGSRIIMSDATGTRLQRSLSRGKEPELPYRPPARREPEPVDDDFEGYVIDPKPGWGQF